MRNLLIISGSLLLFTCCQQQSHTVQETDTTTATAAQQPDTATAVTKTPVISSEKLVSAGKGIGKIDLGSNADKLTELLGKPDFSDAAMGKAWLTWYSKRRDEHNNRNELNIFTTYADSTMR
ncbi:MAG TPA: hypothetical protein VIM87_00975, partial [Chitinophaga sp.]|uniref:hypothetical protein n=1 Tax=Chitinophaga sp. TaxID=1869181 RepID=UPI002F94EB38